MLAVNINLECILSQKNGLTIQKRSEKTKCEVYLRFKIDPLRPLVSCFSPQSSGQETWQKTNMEDGRCCPERGTIATIHKTFQKNGQNGDLF
jgi:hypothetical protein